MIAVLGPLGTPRDRRPADTGRPEISQRLFIPLISLFLDTPTILFDRRRLADVNEWFYFISPPLLLYLYLFIISFYYLRTYRRRRVGTSCAEQVTYAYGVHVARPIRQHKPYRQSSKNYGSWYVIAVAARARLHNSLFCLKHSTI